MDLLGGPGEVDLGDIALPGTLVGHVVFNLLVARGLAGGDQLDGVGHGLHAEREELVAVERVDRVVGADFDGHLKQDRAGVEALVDPEDGHAGHRVALDDGVVDGRASAVFGQHRGVVLNGLQRRELQHPAGDDLRYEGHHVELGVGRLVGGADILINLAAALPAARLVEGETGVARGLGERVGASALALGRGEDADDFVSVFNEPLEDSRAEGGLANQCDFHVFGPSCSTWLGGVSSVARQMRGGRSAAISARVVKMIRRGVMAISDMSLRSAAKKSSSG